MNDQYVYRNAMKRRLSLEIPLGGIIAGLFTNGHGFERRAIQALRSDYESRGYRSWCKSRAAIVCPVAQPVSRLWQERPAKYSPRAALVGGLSPAHHSREIGASPCNIIKTLLERSWIRVLDIAMYRTRSCSAPPSYFNLQKLG